MIVFPDAEDVVCDYLRPLITVPAVTQVPNPRPESFVRVMRTGGPRLNQVADNPMITIEGWGPNELAAQELLQLCRGHIHEMRGTVQSGVAIYRINEVGGPVNLPDPETTQARYSFTAQIAMRGATV